MYVSIFHSKVKTQNLGRKGEIVSILVELSGRTAIFWTLMVWFNCFMWPLISEPGAELARDKMCNFPTESNIRNFLEDKAWMVIALTDLIGTLTDSKLSTLWLNAMKLAPKSLESCLNLIDLNFTASNITKHN